MEIVPGTVYREAGFSDVEAQGGMIVGAEFHDCCFERCNLRESALHDCKLIDCKVKDSDWSLIDLRGSSFTNTTFYGSKLVGIDWTKALWTGSLIHHPLRFEGCILNHSTFIGLELDRIEIIGCSAKDVDFREAHLANADFSQTDLAESVFINTGLNEADFRTAVNYEIAPHQNDIRGAKFALPEAMSLLFRMDICLERGDSGTEEPQ